MLQDRRGPNMSNSASKMDYSPPGSYVHGIFQARVLEWDAIAFSILCLLVFALCIEVLLCWVPRYLQL